MSAGLKMEGHRQVITIRYEDLLQNYEHTVKTLCNFIGEEFDEALMQYPKTAKVKENGAWLEPAQSISTKFISRWKKPEFSERVQELVADPRAVELLKHYRYI